MTSKVSTLSSASTGARKGALGGACGRIARATALRTFSMMAQREAEELGTRLAMEEVVPGAGAVVV